MAINITRVYTRTGDEGTTALVGGERVAKDARRVECYGELDELNAILGLARSLNAQAKPTPARRRLDDVLTRLQNELFDLGSELATPPEAEYEGMFKVTADDVRALERVMDECQKDLEPLRSFVLPGGGPVSAVLHHARTVCRRAERQIIRLAREQTIGAFVIPYVNRLSDLLFVLSRWIGKQNGEAEYLWERGLRNRARPAAARKKPAPRAAAAPRRAKRRGV
ncbi:MAG TPA: cob(I)yrinic acid a,c-diamide adenosyltransferase [Candidatus Dormibacteraeota bacterium]|nr:cob(I)yrinic acid a,c-diamide adenosyltransferase [Candidatus Dormibacteraeota bacterium]